MNRVIGLNENKSKDADVAPAGVQIGTGITPRFVRFTLGLGACANKIPTENTKDIEIAVSGTKKVFMMVSLALRDDKAAGAINRKLIVVRKKRTVLNGYLCP